MTTKICTKCKIEKDTSEFNKSSYTKNGMQCWCKDCLKQRHNENHPEIKHRDIYKNKPGFKTCTKCKIEKSIEEFGKSNRDKDGLQDWCRECKKKNHLDHKEEIPDSSFAILNFMSAVFIVTILKLFFVAFFCQSHCFR